MSETKLVRCIGFECVKERTYILEDVMCPDTILKVTERELIRKILYYREYSVMNISLIGITYKDTKLIINKNSMDKMDMMLRNAFTLGILKEIKMDQDGSVYVMQSGNKTIVYIPDSLKKVSRLFNKGVNHTDVTGTVEVIGGAGLKSADRMFESFNVNKIDLTKFESSCLSVMSGMFLMSNINEIDFGDFKHSNKVAVMHNMFTGLTTKKLDLSWLCIKSNIDFENIY